MKHLKKPFLAIAVTFGLLLSLSSCDEKKETKEIKKTETHETKKADEDNR